MMELGVLRCGTLDIDIGGSNDFELIISRNDSNEKNLSYGVFFFTPGTEYIGILEKRKSTTSSGSYTWDGLTARGLLTRSVIEPPIGSAYMTVSGDANLILKELLTNRFGGIFTVPEYLSDINIKTYQFARYVSVLDGVKAMLATQNARLYIHAERGGSNESFNIFIEAVPVNDYSEEIEYSQNNKLTLTIEDSRMGINHLICLGKGELTERTVIHLYVQEDGSIGSKKYYTGLNERTLVYDYSSAENADALTSAGIKKLKELANYKKMKLEASGVDLQLGDIISGRDRESGDTLSKPIIQKIVKINGTSESIEYKVEGES